MIHSLLSLLVVLPVVSWAVHVPITSVRQTPTTRRTARSFPSHEKKDVRPVVNAVVSDDNGVDLTTVRDLIYMSNMTAGGKEYLVQMDTGSSDAWLKGPTFPLSNSKQTSLTANLTFGIGWASGTVSYIPVEFAGVSISSQAYLDVDQANNPALTYDAQGLIGLGFTSLSTIDHLLNATGSSDGRSLLFNIFEDNSEQDNFITFAFQRSTDIENEVQGGFGIGELEENYTSVADTDRIPTWPITSPKRWNILVEAFIIGDKEVIPATIVPDAPGNKAVALLDTGTSYSYVTKDICDAIYGGIDGASYNAATGYWNVPCSTEIDMAIQIAGRIFPLHPLDISPSSYQGDSSCIGSFVPQTIAADEDQFDYILGVNVLRSMYSLFDFGDFDENEKMGDPYIKLLSLVDPDDASEVFCAARSCTPKSNISYKTSHNTYNGPALSVSVSGSAAEAIQKFSTYFPAMLAIMALNALVLLGLLIFGIVLFIRKRSRKGASARVPTSRMTLNLHSSEASPNHTYEPVSMAMTDDTMVPPNPAFHRFVGTTLRSGERPKSLANMPSTSKSMSYDEEADEPLFSSPSPGFKQFDTRPQSVGILPSHHPTVGEDDPFVPPGRLRNEACQPQLYTSSDGMARSSSTGSYRDEEESTPVTPPSPTPRHAVNLPASLMAPSPSEHIIGTAEENIALPPSPNPSTSSFADLSVRPFSRHIEAAQSQQQLAFRFSMAPGESVLGPTPPSPSARSLRDSARRSIAEGGLQHPMQPMTPRLSPLATGVPLTSAEDQDLSPPVASFARPRLPSGPSSDRPQSAVVLPTQSNSSSMPGSPSPNRRGSGLRPKGSSGDRPMSYA